MNTRESIDQFFKVKRIAMIGVSRNSAEFSRQLMREMIARDYDIIPVNSAVKLIEQRICYNRSVEIPGEVNSAFLMTRAEHLPELAKDCAIAGIKSVWILKSAGDRAKRVQAITILNENLIDVIDGLCPYMYIDNPGMPHTLHRGIARFFGAIPK